MRLLKSAFALSLPVVAVACSSANEPATGGTLNASELAEGTLAFTGAAAADVTVEGSALRFPKATHGNLAGARAGQVLIGERGVDARNREGFLRKVVSVTEQGSDYVVTTEQATLVDAFAELDFNAIVELPKESSATPQGLRTLGSGSGPTKTIVDFSGRQIFQSSGSLPVNPATGSTIGYAASMKVNKGSLTFTPRWDVGAQIGRISLDPRQLLKSAHAIGTGSLDAQLEVQATLALTGNPTGADIAALIAQSITGNPNSVLADTDITLASLNLGPLNAPATAKFRAELTCSVDWGGTLDVVVGANANATLSAGFRYADQRFTPVFEKTGSFSPIGPNYTVGGAVRVLCEVVPRFELRLFGVATGALWARPYLSLGAEAECNTASGPALTGKYAGYLFAGVGAAASLDVDLFGLYSYSKECTLFDLNRGKNVAGTFPLPGGASATCTSVPIPPRPEPSPLPGELCFASAQSTGAQAACLPNGSPIPTGWTCDAAKFGDCNCDCNCGAADRDCAAGACGTCTHDVCRTGAPLGNMCTDDGQGGACIRAICDADPYCCTTAWGASCVDKVKQGLYGCTPRTCR
jgi:hypothetical protein